jgi:murein DD-endopeptidase MepM/ murein hydrolase activator NlpD
MTWMHPFPESTVTGEYGTISEYRRQRGMQPHSGRDYAPKGNTPIPSVSAGTLRLLQWSDVLGWVAVYSAMGKTSESGKQEVLYIGYSHLSCNIHGINCKGPKVLGEHSPMVSTKIGDKKELGKPVGRCGNTGSASSGPHLHLTISKTLKGVFGSTSQKLDPKIVIDANLSVAPKPKSVAPAKTAPKTKPVQNNEQPSIKAETIYACPHCKKELK